MAFGRRMAAPAAGLRRDPAAEEPWGGALSIAANLAIGNMREFILAALSEPGGRVHAESLISAAGALTGYAAQHAALVDAAVRQRNGQQLGPEDLLLVGTTGGENFLFGDMINLFLFGRPGQASPLGSVMGAALDAGADRSKLPDFATLLRQVAGRIGQPDFGTLRMPDGSPLATRATEWLALWPKTRETLRLPPPFGGDALPEAHWPLALALASSQFLSKVKGVLTPAAAASLFAQSALICSKVDPRTVEKETWQLTAAAGRLSVKRLLPN